jgi:CBS domain-containing protein
MIGGEFESLLGAWKREIEVLAGSLVSRLRDSTPGSPMEIVADILRSKPDQAVHTTAPTTSVLDAMRLMAAKGIGALVVMDSGEVVGIVTERDYARKTEVKARTGKDMLVRDIMTALVIRVRPDQTTEDCIALMAKNKMRHLPVMDGNALVGMISIRDLVDGIIERL